MADDLHRLLIYIVEHPILQDETREAQLDATAVQDVQAEIAAVSQEQRQHAERLAPYFAQGLRMAGSQRSSGPLVVDDTTEEGGLIADAFARYLVSPDLAASQGEPISDTNFRYTFEVNWMLLSEVARRAGIDLDAVLK
jgi:hypothetical protein